MGWEKEKKDNSIPEHSETIENISDNPSIITEFWEFLRENKKFWLIPVIIVLLIMALLIFFSGTAVAPFLYTIF